MIQNTYLKLHIDDCIEVLKNIRKDSVDLILLDPPYNIDIAYWDTFEDYISWARLWIDECFRVLSPTGNLVIFGGTKFQGKNSGDLIELLHYIRHNTKFNFVNTIVWYYKNGISAHRFFSNRHEEIIWLTKSKDYYFDLDSVRIPYDTDTLNLYKRDKRLNVNNLEKGKNPTNVWEIGRLNANSKERVGHPTQKPKEIIRRLIKSLTQEGGLVLDFFAGSGVTGVVAIEENRSVILGDIDPMTKNYLIRHFDNAKLNLSKYIQ